MTRSGELSVARTTNGLSMDFPSDIPKRADAPAALLDALGTELEEVLVAADLIAVLSSEDAVSALEPNFNKLESLAGREVIATAPGRKFDFVSRCFYPKLGVNEDPVTGSAHCQLVPYWSEKLCKTELSAKQLSRRGGLIRCEYRGQRVRLSGSAVTFMKAEIEVPEKSNKMLESDA